MSATMRRAWHDRDRLVDELALALLSVNFDGIVVSGVSGLIIGPLLTQRYGVHFAYVRKQGELTRNTWRLEGSIANRWVFVDDFVSTGRTFAHVCAEVQKFYGRTTCVGILQYVPKVSFSPIARVWELQRSWNHVGMRASDIPGFVSEKRDGVAL